MKIQLVSVFVEDPVKAFKFYTETLGFIERTFMPEYYLAIVASPEEPNGTGLLLEPRDDKIAKPYQAALREAGLPCMTFGTADIQKEYERLKSRGVVFKQEPTKTDYGIEAVFDDTFNNYLQLVQMT